MSATPNVFTRLLQIGVWLAAVVTLPVVAADPPLVIGLDHVPVVVRDLEAAVSDFRALGFAIKPGRQHANGNRNAHVKFTDGTELELITSSDDSDALSAEYAKRLLSGEGPVYFGLYAVDRPALAGRIRALGYPTKVGDGMIGFASTSALHPLFFGGRNAAPTDRPEHFQHCNSAVRLSGNWTPTNPALRDVLTSSASR